MTTHEGDGYSTAAHDFIFQQIEQFRKDAEVNLRGAKYAAFYSIQTQHMDHAPIELILGSPFGHSDDYGSGVFEGGSAVVNERTGVPCVVLHQERMNRLFDRSLPARGYAPHVLRQEFSDAIIDTVAVHGLDLFLNPDPNSSQKYVRAYIRPSVHPKPLNGYGVSLRKGYPIEAVDVTFTWPDYLDPSVYTQGGVAAITGHQRLFPITGKHASNYGSAGVEGNLARSLGATELIYLAPYLVDDKGFRFWADPNDTKLKLLWGAIADAPGEEVVGFLRDSKTMVYTPMRVNRLGGTVLEYIKTYIAPRLGLNVIEADITLTDLRAGKYSSLAMVGNAVKVAPIRKIQLYEGDKQLDPIILFEKGNIPDPLVELQQRWQDETTGIIDPSHESLLTPVDVRRGDELREALQERFYVQ